MHNLDEFARELFTAAPALPEALRDDGDDTEPDPDFPGVWLADLGRALARVLPSLDARSAASAFASVEHYLTLADDELSTAVATELLEALANAVSSGRLAGPTLAAVLGPESRAYIDAWDQFTLGRSSLEPDH